jgi:hypothetical protein
LSEEEIINKIITETLPREYDKSLANYWKNDLNEDGKPEIIITAIPFKWTTQAYLVVVTVLDNKGNYKKIMDFDFYQKEEELTFLTAPYIEMVKDINNDGLIEIYLRWSMGAMRSLAFEAFLVLDWPRQTIDWLKLIDENGKVVPAIFGTGSCPSSAGLWIGRVEIIDVNKDGILEIVKIDESSSQYYGAKEVKIEDRETKVYEWNGSIYSHNKKLSTSGTTTTDMPE